MSNFQTPIADFMTSPVHTVEIGASLVEVNEVLSREQISALPVVDSDKSVKGLVSRTDLLHAMVFEDDGAYRLPERSVEEVMQSPAITVSPDQPLTAAAKAMLSNHVHRAVVTKDDVLAGVISTRDLMSAVAQARVKTPVSEFGSRSIVKVNATDSVALAVERLDLSNKHGIVVVDGEFSVGTFDQACALEARGLEPNATVDQAMNVRFLVLPPRMPLGRAAAQAMSLHVRRILLEDERGVFGIVSGLDFARALV